MTTVEIDGFKYVVHYPGGKCYSNGKYNSTADGFACFEAIVEQNPALVDEMIRDVLSLTPETTNIKSVNGTIFDSKFWNTFIFLAQIYDPQFQSFFYASLMTLILKRVPKDFPKRNLRLYNWIRRYL